MFTIVYCVSLHVASYVHSLFHVQCLKTDVNCSAFSEGCVVNPVKTQLVNRSNWMHYFSSENLAILTLPNGCVFVLVVEHINLVCVLFICCNYSKLRLMFSLCHHSLHLTPILHLIILTELA